MIDREADGSDSLEVRGEFLEMYGKGLLIEAIRDLCCFTPLPVAQGQV